MLATISVLTLLFSIVSTTANPGYFASLNAFAEEQNDNTGSDEEVEEEHDRHDKDKREEHQHYKEHTDEKKAFSKVELETHGEGIEIEVKMEGLDMTSGMYNVTLSCEEPAFSVTLDDAFNVYRGTGKLEVELGLGNGTYSGCELAVAGTGMVIASFDSFTVQEGYEEKQEQKVEEKRKERLKELVSTAKEIHKKLASVHPASHGEYEPGLSYILVASGTLEHRDHEEDHDEVNTQETTNSTDSTATNSTNTATTNSTSTNSTSSTTTVTEQGANAELTIDMAVWKSNRALVLLNVLGGTIEVEDQVYTIALGHAIYSIKHDILRISALVIDESGNNVLKLKLRGDAVAEDASLPMGAGESLDLVFEGNSGPSKNRLGSHYELIFEGTMTAQEQAAETYSQLVHRIGQQEENDEENQETDEEQTAVEEQPEESSEERQADTEEESEEESSEEEPSDGNEEST